ncbi:Uncharacterised protein [Mycoplasmopsis columbina]|nr:hypothetical protein [Mycoplasmopsis columbina]VEU76983.1 Uncharacterised protein [Mycoplasmopsis columbina]
MLYNHLFVDSSLFNDEDFNKYIKINNSDYSLENSSPIFKNLDNLNNVEYTRQSLTYQLYKATGKQTDLRTSNYYWKASNLILKSKNKNWKMHGKYGGYWRTWNNINHGIPSILGVYPSNFEVWPPHAYLMYGYDDDTDMFLGSFCWGSSETNTALYSYYNGAFGSYYFTITGERKNKELKKLFSYKNKKYTGEEITKMIEQKEK